jgi:radical SAM protein with 4Fe4S-binding SPASM domain
MNPVDRSDTAVPDFPKRVLIGIQDGYCNLNCPVCHVHGNGAKAEIERLKGQMSYDDACRVFSEFSGTGSFIHPALWSEPLLMRDFCRYIQAMKHAGLHIFINTNGLLLDRSVAEFLIDIEIHSLFVSIDAATETTLRKTRGIGDLERIQRAVFQMLKLRGDSSSPRIGVSFTESHANSHEKPDFLSFWIEHVDVVRVNALYETDNRIENADIPAERVPCGALYDTMAINHRGDVQICCLDSFNQTHMGNVLRDGVKAVWHGEQLQGVRALHEAHQYDKIPLCRKCDVWANYSIDESESQGILVRRSPVMTYYNRVDRMYSWHSRVR